VHRRTTKGAAHDREPLPCISARQRARRTAKAPRPHGKDARHNKGTLPHGKGGHTAKGGDRVKAPRGHSLLPAASLLSQPPPPPCDLARTRSYRLRQRMSATASARVPPPPPAHGPPPPRTALLSRAWPPPGKAATTSKPTGVAPCAPSAVSPVRPPTAAPCALPPSWRPLPRAHRDRLGLPVFFATYR
jgi:hypothetical protein